MFIEIEIIKILIEEIKPNTIQSPINNTKTLSWQKYIKQKYILKFK